MSRARVSIVVYGAYLAAAGVVMGLFPDALMALARITDTHDFWVRIAGVLSFVVGIKAIQNSYVENTTLFRFDNFTRTLAATFMVILVVMGIAPKIILVLSALEYGSSIWTELAIRADKRRPVRAMVA
ncbi:MAG: hypothetical protein ABSE46_07930 [Terracidiphilus sp.]|jgi:hypothetical protein